MTDQERIATLEKRIDLLVGVLKREFSGMGRPFGTETFDKQWAEAAEPEEEAP